VYPVLRRGETWTGEIDMTRSDGSVMRVLQTVVAEVGDDGEPERGSALGRDVSDERQALDELAYQATHDALTGLPNRSLLIDHLELALARSARDNRPVGVLFIDLDRFNMVNDTYGHDTGDKLLRELAQRMESVLRPSDTVARLGGDEFVVLCEDIDGELDALTIADRIRAAIDEEPARIDGIELHVSASIGIALSNGGAGREPDNLLQRADAAMYRAKDAGRGRTELFDDVLRDRTNRRAERADQLEQAIDDGALDVHYQPLVDLHSGRVVGVEALVRWLHPASGLLGPSEFLALAIETGLAPSLDELVLHRACVDAAAWCRELGDRCPAVNVDGGTLLSGRIADIAKRGVKIAIDDVGTGATRLSRLGRFELDVLKIDGSLTNDVVASESARQLIRNVVALGQAMGLQVAAESIEDASAIPVLRDLGVDVAQGHVFSAAIPAAKLEPLLTLRSTLARDDR
jgi:diguanylate cyclase (GGDEF)-like protein